MARRAPFLIEIFLVSMAAIILEISFTRILSFKLYYYFTYLIIGIAMLGLGAGGVLTVTSKRLRSIAPPTAVTTSVILAALAVPMTYLVVALLQFNTIDLLDEPTMVVRLLVICFSLFVPFLCIGITLAVLFGSYPKEMNRLYFADLVGAGLGCFVCVPIFTRLSPPAAIAFSGWLLAIAAVFSAWRYARQWRAAAITVAVLASGLVAAQSLLPEPVPDRTKTMSPQRLQGQTPLFSRWTPLFRIDVLSTAAGKPNDLYLIAHDGMARSGLHRFDGDLEKLDHFNKNIRSKPFSILGEKPNVLIIGAAGGDEILASMYFDAGKITAVELNPATVSLLTDHFADFTGRIAYDPRVDLVNAEGRSFLETSQETYDLIWFVAPDSYAAMNAASSGAYVLSESYLFTVEMVELSLSRLREKGIVCVQWGEVSPQRSRAIRYMATAREAYRRLGIRDFAASAIVSVAPDLTPGSTLILRNEPFSPAEIETYRANANNIAHSDVWHPRDRTEPQLDHPLRNVMELDDDALARWYESYDHAVHPVTDNSPFFWHFTRFSDAPGRRSRLMRDLVNWEGSLGEQTLLALLAVVVLFATAFILAPLMVLREVWPSIPMKRYAFLYFASLGLGFMFFEVCMIQRLTLFLGYPTYSLTVTLFSLLVFSGVGSLLSERYALDGNRNRALFLLLVAITVLMLFYRLGLGPTERALAAATLPARVTVAIAVLAPLGLCLGAFMPIGIRSIAALATYQREYVAWAWAVNAFFSVVASVLSTILAMAYGFNVVLLLAVGVYTVGILALSRVPARIP